MRKTVAVSVAVVVVIMVIYSGTAFAGWECSSGDTYYGYSTPQTGLCPNPGHWNTFVGGGAGHFASLGSNNSYFGAEAGSSFSGATGSSNTFVGAYAGVNNAAGGSNSFFGSSAGYSNTTGNGNVIVGYQAGHENLDGSYNTYIGYWAGLNSLGSHNVFLGNVAGYSLNGSNKLYIDSCPSGVNCVTPLIYGEFDNRIVVINGSLTMSAVLTPSDIRYKKDVEPLTSSLDRVTRLKGVSYSWKTDEHPSRGFGKGKQIGLIAQDVEKVVPELVTTDDKGYKSISYDKLVPVLVEAIKEQNLIVVQQKTALDEKSKIVDEQQQLLAALAVKLEKLEAEVIKLKNRDITALK